MSKAKWEFTEVLGRPKGRNQRELFAYECFSALGDSSLFGGCVFRILGYQQAEQMPGQHPAGSPKALNAANIHRSAKTI